MINKQYGYFDKDTSDYHITEANLPRNWYNYLWNDSYISFTSQTGAGESFIQDALGKRISLVKERGVFLIEGDTHWGISGLPVNEKRDSYSCVHQRGATTICTENYGISSEFITIVPRNANCELWSLKIKNNTECKRSVRAIAFCGSAFDEAYVRQGYNVGVAKYDDSLNGVVIESRKTFNGMEKGLCYGFMALSEAADGYDCTYNTVIGPYGSFAHPVVLERGGCTNTEGCGEKLAFALEKEIQLDAGEEKVIVLVCGIAFSKEEMYAMKAEFVSEKAFEEEKSAVLAKFSEEINQVSIDTPDEELNHMFEWLKHQSNLGARWARVRHNGYRDIVSDTDCLAAVNPRKALECFVRILSYQYSNGYAPRTFKDGAIQDQNFADNTVWLNFTAYSILRELGDESILDMEVPYNDGTKGSIYEHLKKSVDFLYHFRGHHELIRIWGGDWNDCMNTAGLEGKGVSVWLSIAWYRANKEFAEIAKIYGNLEDMEEAHKRGEEMQAIIEKYGWDGEYYLDAINDEGRKIGSKECEEGQMFLIPQLWSVLSGVSKDGREVQAMDAVEKYLSSPLGTIISIPPYTKYDAGIGVVTTKPAGVHENGGVYLHTIAWKIAADAMLKRADHVEKDIETILPFRNKIVAGRAEPYIMCNSYFGEQTGYRYGTPGQSWRTASGQWFQKALVNYVFGLQPEMEGLRIKPCLPPSWKNCSITKEFRGCTYHIKYENEGTCVKEIRVNGEVLNGTLLPILSGDVEVKVITEKESYNTLG